MSRPRSLRRDLAVGFGVAVTALWLIALAGSWMVLRDEVTEIYDAALERTAGRLLAVDIAGAGVETPGSAPAESEAMSYLLRSLDGTILAQSEGADPADFGAAPRTGFREQGDLRMLGVAVGKGRILEIADPLQERREAAQDVLLALLVPAAFLLPFGFLIVARITGTRLRPVAQLAAQVSGRDPRNLEPLSVPDLQAELVPVREAIDRLMERLADALDAERAFSANAAHELRTPIAAALAQTQRLIAEAPNGALRNRARAVEVEMKRVARLSEKLLDLARAESGGLLTGSTEDLRPALSLIVRDFADAPGLQLTLPSTPVAAAIDLDAFAILARNLIENAVRHGLPPIEITLDGDATLCIANRGAPLPAEDLARLTRRFERLGSSRQGSGLGLAIVETLVRNSNARIDLLSPAPGRPDGLAVVVALPSGVAAASDRSVQFPGSPLGGQSSMPRSTSTTDASQRAP